MKKKRVFLIVLDSFGIGAAPDAHDFGDAGANTLLSVSKSDKFNVPSLISLGLGNIDGVECINAADAPLASYGRMRELSLGKDTTVGHWELMGLVSKSPLPTFPRGLPKEMLDKFSSLVGLPVLCGMPRSGTEVIEEYGTKHTESGALIVYTSADSVFQIAAHEECVSREKLYEYCRIARDMLVGRWGVGRVIARPFAGKPGSFYRTDGRRDFSLEPTGKTVLDKLCDLGITTVGVGKINDIFAGRGLTLSYPTHSNKEGIDKTLEIMRSDFSGLCFTNLVDFDMLFGHRQDRDGYAEALSSFDLSLPEMLEALGDDGTLIITADHGCDPSDGSTDHTREYVPLLVFGKGHMPQNLGTIDGFSFVGELILKLLHHK